MSKVQQATRILAALEAGEYTQAQIALELEKVRFVLAQMGVCNAGEGPGTI